MATKRNSSVYSTPAPDPRRLTSSSLDVTESSSFKGREAELQSVADRFADSQLRRGSTLPATSRFREEFDEPSHAKHNNKPSFLSKLHFTLPRRVKFGGGDLDGTSMDVVLRPSPLSQTHRPDETQPTSLSTKREQSRRVSNKESSGYHMPSEGDSALELWQKAARQESEQRLSVCRQSSRQNSRSASRESRTPEPCPSKQAAADPKKHVHRGVVILNTQSVGRHEGDNDEPVSPHTVPHSHIAHSRDSESFQEAYERSRRAFLRYVEVSDEEEARLKVQKRHSSEAKQPVKKRSIVPNAWARFPSHTRAVRYALASSTDDVVSKDFALPQPRTPGTAVSSTNSSSPLAETSGKKSDSRSVSGKISRAMKHGLEKLLPTKTVVDGDVARSKIALPKFAHPDPTIEYPELTLLPGAAGFKELRAIEREVRQLKPPSSPVQLLEGQKTQAQDCSSAEEPRSSGHFGGDASSDCHIATPKESDGSPTGAPAAIENPATPAPAFLRPDHGKSSSATTTDRFHTPLSRLSPNNTSSTDARPSLGAHVSDHSSEQGSDTENVDPKQRQWQSARKHDDTDSVNSDVTVLRKSKSTTEPDLRTLGRRYAARSRYGTWAGRARTLNHMGSKRGAAALAGASDRRWDDALVAAPPPTLASPSEVGGDDR
jgi:hypothetical protein